MNWRPEGWCIPLEIKPLGESGKTAWLEIDKFSFEAGADAMLEALREKGNADLLRFIYAVVKVRPIETIGKGKFVFIPDEEVS